MLGILRLAKAISRNPWLLIPIVGLIAAAVILEVTVLRPAENPLPVANLIQEARLVRGPVAAGSPAADVFGMDYVRLRMCLDDCEAVTESASGEPVATLFVQGVEGDETGVVLYPDGLIGVGGATYRVSNGEHLLRVIEELVPKPRPRRVSRRRARR